MTFPGIFATGSARGAVGPRISSTIRGRGDGRANITFIKARTAGARASQFLARLREHFTREPTGNAFLGWQSYYRACLEESPGRTWLDHRGPFVGDERHLAAVMAGMVAGQTSFLITAPPGCGKSRFALELARRLAQAQRSWRVAFVRHDETAVDSELHALAQTERCVLIVDDAHECPALVQKLAALSSRAQAPSHIHLVCLSQPAAERMAVAQALASPERAQEPLEVDLGRPTAGLLRELIDQRIPQLSPHHRDVIRRSVADSFAAAVLLCSSVARQKNLPQTLSPRNLREYALRQPVAQAVRDLCPVDKALRALAVYAICGPVRPGDPAIRASAASASGLSASDVELIETRLLEAGVFQTDARGGMRPVPQVLGDLILEETCLDEHGRPTAFGESLIGLLLEQRRYEPVMRLAGELARLFATGARLDRLNEQILERAVLAVAQMPAAVFDLLEGCSRLACRRPSAVVRLIDTLAQKGVLQAAPAAQSLLRPDSPEARALVLLLSAGEHDATLVGRAMEYSRQLLVHARADAAADRSIHEKLSGVCRFAVARSLAHATAVLDVLHGWAQGSDADSAELAASLVHGYLQLERHSQRWQHGAPTPSSVTLNTADEIWKVRDRALDILARCVGHESPTVQRAAAGSLEHWARGFAKLPDELRARWAPQLRRELDFLVEHFSRLGSATAHLPVRAALERQGWRWWTEGPEPFIQHSGKRLLDVLPEGTLYPLWKALHEPGLPVFAVPADELGEPAQRRERLLALIDPATEHVVQRAGKLFDRLDPLHADPAAWSAAFTSVLSATPGQPLQAGSNVYVAELVRRHPAAAWSFVTEASAAGPLGRILPALLAELRGRDPARWHGVLAGSVPGTRLFEVELGALCAAGDLDDAERELVSKGLELEDAQAVHLAAQVLLNASRSALAPGLAAVMAVLPRRPTDQKLWDLTLTAFVRWGHHVLSAPQGEEPEPELRALSGVLLRLLRAEGSAVSWSGGPDATPLTTVLTTVLAIFAVTIPHTLRSALRESAPAIDTDIGCEPPLAPGRICAAMRLLGRSPGAAYWQKQFAEWITQEPDLSRLAAKSLAALRPLMADSPAGLEPTLDLLRSFADRPEVYELLEEEMIAALAPAASGRAGRESLEARSATLQALEEAADRSALPPLLRETLARARRAIQAAIEQELLQIPA